MTDHTNIAAAFVAAQSQLTHVVKGKTGQARGATYKYAEMADVVEMLRPLLKSHGLGFQSINSPHRGGAVVRTKLIHESGETMESDGTFVPAGDIVSKDGRTTPAGAQQYGSAYTYARRYDLIAMLGIAADDDDGAAAMQEHAKKVERAQKAASAPKLDASQLAVLEEISAACGHPDRDRSDMLAEDFPKHVSAAIEYAVKQKIVQAGDAPDIEAAALALDYAKVRVELGGVAA